MASLAPVDLQLYVQVQDTYYPIGTIKVPIEITPVSNSDGSISISVGVDAQALAEESQGTPA
jgi:hypothetical protein